MAISAVKITDGCTLCGLCEQICPEVFKMGDAAAEVIPGVNFTQFEAQIRDAAASCPVSVIEVSD